MSQRTFKALMARGFDVETANRLALKGYTLTKLKSLDRNKLGTNVSLTCRDARSPGGGVGGCTMTLSWSKRPSAPRSLPRKLAASSVRSICGRSGE